MTEITRKITVDLARRGSVRLIFARQNDFNSRKIQIYLTNAGVPFPVEKTSVAIVNFARADGTSGAFYGEIEDDGSITVVLGGWQLAVEGEVKCSVSIFSENEKKLTSSNFYLDVETALYIGDEITEDEDYSMLTSLMSEISKINYDEEARKAAELDRSDRENQRQTKEIERENAEMLRFQSESERKASEEGRVEAEAARVFAENERNEIVGDLDSAVDKIIGLQEKIIEDGAEIITKEEIKEIIDETMLIADNLETDDAYKALSAAQGVVLATAINRLNWSIGNFVDILQEDYNQKISQRCKIHVGSYNGTDTNTLELIFPFVPKAVMIIEHVSYINMDTTRTHISLGIILPENGVLLRLSDENGIKKFVTNNSNVSVTLNEKTMILTSAEGTSTAFQSIFNIQSTTGCGYWYYAIG